MTVARQGNSSRSGSRVMLSQASEIFYIISDYIPLLLILRLIPRRNKCAAIHLAVPCYNGEQEIIR